MRALLSLIILAACGGGTESAVCGDGELDEREACDDGNQIVGDGCTRCELDAPSACGDGVKAFDEICDDGNVASGDGCSETCLAEEVLSMEWSFLDVASGQNTTCPAGFDTVRIVAQEVDDVFMPIGDPVIALFPCADGAGASAFLPAQYLTFLEVTDSAGTEVYARSLLYIVDLAEVQGTIPVTIVNDGGYFGVRWELRGASSNNLLTCAQAGTPSVLVTVTSSTTATDDRVDCTHGGALTMPRLAGAYTVTLSAQNAAQQAVGTAPPLVERTIVAPNGVTDLGLITIPIIGM